MLSVLNRWRRGCLTLALVVLVSAFASGRAQAHAPQIADETRAAAPCHQSDTTRSKQTDLCKAICTIGSQDRLTAPALVMPAPSVHVRYIVRDSGIIPPDVVRVRILESDTAPPPRRLARDRRLLI